MFSFTLHIINDWTWTNLSYLVTISFDEVRAAENNYHELFKAYWYQHNYLTPRWWFLVVLSVIPAIIWWLVVDKKNLIEITSFGLFYGVAAIFLDSIGSNAMVWAYPVRLSPYISPQMYPYDVGVVIIPFMLVYQRWSLSFKKFLISTGVLSAFLAFIAETSMAALGIYMQITWKHIYSFLIYWVLGIICWLIIKQFKALAKGAN